MTVRHSYFLNKLLFFVCFSLFQSLLFFPKIKRQVLLVDAEVKGPKDIHDGTMFWVNQEFALMWVELCLSIWGYICAYCTCTTDGSIQLYSSGRSAQSQCFLSEPLLSGPINLSPLLEGEVSAARGRGFSSCRGGMMDFFLNSKHKYSGFPVYSPLCPPPPATVFTTSCLTAHKTELERKCLLIGVPINVIFVLA